MDLPLAATAESSGTVAWGKRWSTVLVVMTCVFLAVFVVHNRADWPQAWRAGVHARLGWLAVGVLAVAAWQVSYAALHAWSQRAAGLDATVSSLLPVTAGANSVNLLTKSGGMAGLRVVLGSARRHGRGRGATVAAYLLAQALTEVAFAVTLPVALVSVAVQGRLTRPELAAGALFVVYLGFRLTVIALAVSSQEAVRRVWTAPRRLFGWVARRPVGVLDLSVADELHEAMRLVRAHPARCLPAFLAAMSIETVGVVQLWAVMVAVGASHSLVVALIGYSVSVLFGIVGVLPAGVGVVEVSLGALLVSYGASVGAAAAAVVIYRILELWVPVVVGAGFLRRVGEGKVRA